MVKNRLFFIGVCVFSALTALPLIAVLGKVLLEGWQQIHPDFFLQSAPSTLDAMLAKSAGDRIPGGIANGIVGTLSMVLTAAIAATPTGIFCGIYLSENKNTAFAAVVRFLTDLLQGTPSIVIGMIVYAWAVIPMKTYSALAGSAALAVMMLPLIVRSTEETLKMLPSHLKEAGLALGGSYATVVLKVLLPSAMGGILTGILLAVSRVAGETAPLMLTALGANAVQLDMTRPSSAVPLLIWEFYNDPNLQTLIWSASLFLLLFILTLHIIAKQIRKKWKTY
jgi:phosphate transport system permease protein